MRAAELNNIYMSNAPQVPTLESKGIGKFSPEIQKTNDLAAGSISLQKPLGIHKFLKGVKNLNEQELVRFVRLNPLNLPEDRAVKIRKMNSNKKQNYRSAKLERSLLLCRSETGDVLVFPTGKRKEFRLGTSCPGGADAPSLGRGAFKQAFLVKDLNSLQPKAIAIPKSKFDQYTIKTMKKESEMTGRIDSPYVHRVQYFARAAKPNKETAYLVSEVCIGSLSEMMRQDSTYLHKHPEIKEQISSAYKTVHKAGIAHLDGHTGNIFIGEAPDGRVIAKLADFGCAKELAEEDAMTRADMLLWDTQIFNNTFRNYSNSAGG